MLTLTFEFFVTHVVDATLEGPLRRLAARPGRLDRVAVQVLAQPAQIAVANEGVPRQVPVVVVSVDRDRDPIKDTFPFAHTHPRGMRERELFFRRGACGRRANALLREREDFSL